MEPNQPDPEIPPTNDSSNTDPNAALLQQALQATQDARIAAENTNIRLQQQILELQQQRNTPTPAPEVTAEQFFTNPMAHLNAAIQAQIAPLQRDAALLTRMNAYGRLKQQLQETEQYGKWVKMFSANLDQIFENPNVGVTAQNMITIINSMIGNAVSANPALLNTPAPINTPETPKVITPPHLRPSSSPSSTPTNAPRTNKKNYTEEEKRLMRENKMTEEQWEHFTTTGNMPGTGMPKENK